MQPPSAGGRNGVVTKVNISFQRSRSVETVSKKRLFEHTAKTTKKNNLQPKVVYCLLKSLKTFCAFCGDNMPRSLSGSCFLQLSPPSDQFSLAPP